MLTSPGMSLGRLAAELAQTSRQTQPRGGGLHRRTSAWPALQTFTAPDLRAEYHKGNLATMDTWHAFNPGSLSVTRVFEASGPERATTFPSARTATAVAETARPFTMVRVDAGRGASRLLAELPLLGTCVGAGWAFGAAGVGAGVVGESVLGGSGAGAASPGGGLSGLGATVGIEGGEVGGPASF